MKRILSVILAAVVLFYLSAGVSAEERAKETDVNLSTAVETVNVGETVTLTAETLKHGSSYTDEWSGAQKTDTVLDEESGCYVSTAIFTAEEPGIYTVSYTIQMQAGKSMVLFSATASKTIEVTGEKTVKGVEIKNLTVNPVRNTAGDVVSYLAVGNIYILWSDGTSTLYGTTSFFFGPDQYSKEVTVKVYVDGDCYSFTVDVSR